MYIIVFNKKSSKYFFVRHFLLVLCCAMTGHNGYVINEPKLGVDFNVAVGQAAAERVAKSAALGIKRCVAK
jgi:hypothetical protein